MASVTNPQSPSARESSPIASDRESAAHWHSATRIAFRFCFVYFGLYVIVTQMLEAFLPIPGFQPPELGIVPPARPLFLWIGTHILRVTWPTPCCTTATGDTMFGWVSAFSLLLIAMLGTLVWSAAARRRTEHARLFAWFRLFLRVALGVSFVFYGLIKVIPEQMPILDLRRLVEPFGDFSPMGVLWSSIGVSPAYEIALGSAEVLGGLLLFFPATTLVGAILCLMDATMVFLMNMTYDVNLKLFSFHLIAMSLVLIAPNARPLFDLFILHRTRSLRPEPAVVSSPSAWRKIVIGQVVFCLYGVALIVISEVHTWKTYAGGAPRSPLFGIWEVDSIVVGGVTKAPLLSDSTRWRRVIFQRLDTLVVQRMDDSFRSYYAPVDSAAGSISLSTGDAGQPKWVLRYLRVGNEHLLIDGTMNASQLHVTLTVRDPDSFLQRRRGFHWVNEVPFNQ